MREASNPFAERDGLQLFIADYKALRTSAKTLLAVLDEKRKPVSPDWGQRLEAAAVDLREHLDSGL